MERKGYVEEVKHEPEDIVGDRYWSSVVPSRYVAVVVVVPSGGVVVTTSELPALTVPV